MLEVLLIFFLIITKSVSFKFKEKITVQTDGNGKKDVKMMVSFKFLSDFWRTLKLTVKLISF